MPAPKPRSTVAAMARYQPNLNTAPTGRIIRLSANEGALGPSPRALEAIAAISDKVHLYPEEDPAALSETIARTYDLDPERIVFGCGSDELILALCLAYLEPGDEAIHTEYGFLMYPISTRTAGGIPVSAPDNGYRVDVDAVLERVTDRTRIVFLANPNNPTGSYLSRQELHRLHRGLPDHVLLAIDSAYAEFVTRNDYSPGAELVESTENVVMLRTFSKLYAMAGLRLGWAYTPQHVAEAMHVVKQPFGANRLAVAAATAALEDTEFLACAVEHNSQWLPWTSARLQGLGLAVLPSVANFLMVQFPDAPGYGAAEAGNWLSGRGILTRGMAGYGAPDFIRMSIGTGDDMQIVVDSIGDFLNARTHGR